MSTSVGVHELRMERLVRKVGGGNIRAEFYSGGDLYCTANICLTTNSTQITPYASGVNVEMASTLAIALQMAISWATEELTKIKEANGLT